MYIITAILVFILTMAYLLREPVTQTILARFATTSISKKLHTEVKIEGVYISSLSSVRFKNILIRDVHQDTLLYSKYMQLHLEKPFYKTSGQVINRVDIDGALFNLITFKDDGRNNMGFLLDFFSQSNQTDTPIANTTNKDEAGVSDEGAGNSALLVLKEILISNSKFAYFDQRYSETFDGINYEDVAVRNINARIKNFKIHADTISLLVEQLSLMEKSGFSVDSLACNFAISNTFMQAQELKAITPLNKLDLDFRFTYKSMADLGDFIHLVDIQANIRPSLINLSEVGFFAPVMYPMDNRFRVRGNLRGTVTNFKAKDFRFGMGKATQFKGDVQMTGLPDIKETFTHLSIKDFTTNKNDLAEFRLPAEPAFMPVPEILARLGTIRIKGKFTGFYNDFVSYASFKSRLGEINTDLLLRVNAEDKIAYDGHLEAHQFDAGTFLNLSDNVGKLTMKANINGSGIDFDHMKISMDGIVDSLEFNENNYNEIVINGDLSDKKFIGQFVVDDELLDLDFTGTLDYSQNIPAYNFTADIPKAFLDKINLVHRDETSELSTRLRINIIGNKPDNMQGIIQLDSTIYSEKGQLYLMNDFTLSITRESDNYAFLNLYSDLLDASLEGDFKIAEMKDRGLIMLKAYLNHLISQSLPAIDSLAYQDFIFNITLKNTEPLTQLFVPDLEFSEGTHLSGGYNSQINNLFFDGTSSEIDFMGKKFKDCYVELFMQDSSVRLNSGSRQLVFSDTLKSDSLKISLTAYQDTLLIQTQWDDYSPTPLCKGRMSGPLVFLSPHDFTFHFNQAEIQFTNALWHIDRGNYLQIDSNRIQFYKMGLASSNQGLFIQGAISPLERDTLELGFHNFDLSNFDLLLHNLDIDLDGYANGGLQLIDYYHSPFYLSDLHIDSLKFNKEKLGEAELLTSWNPVEQAFDIDGNIIYSGNIGKNKTLDISGYYYPEREKDNFNIDMVLNKYKLLTLRPFLSSFGSEVEGLATGRLQIRGSKSKPDITGLIKLMHCGLRIDYTNVKYYFADQVAIDPNDIHFNNIEVYDSINNKALLSGHIYHNYLKDFRFDLDIKALNVAGLNTTRKQNSAFYGYANASGNVKISGPVNQLNLNMDISFDKGTDIKIPVSYGTEVGNNDYIVFTNTMKDKEIKKETRIQNMNGVSLQMGMKLTNDANIQLFMPYNMGNIRARGNGDIRMDIDQTLNLNMDGEYIIDRGTFFFTLKNIINRTFDIQRGSKVSWTGDPYNAQINLKALYKVKTTLGEYGPPQDSSTRVPVDCIIELRNQLLNPEIRFTLEFPELKEDTKQFIYSRLDTNDQAMMGQQMISLLVLNSFSSSSGYSGNVGFNTFSLVTNQLNNWLSSISNDFDIGVNYRPGNALSAQEVEVALSTQLFEDRVLIDGNVGMKDKQSTENTNNIVGEVNVEVKITPDGRFRAKAFNKSNNSYLYKNYSPYTQGVGIFYTQEFNKLSDLFGKRKKKLANSPVTESQKK